MCRSLWMNSARIPKKSAKLCVEFSGWYLTDYWGDANTEVSSALLRFIQQHWWIPHRKENSIVHSWPTFIALYGPLFLTENPKDSWEFNLQVKRLTDRQTDVQRGFSLCMAEKVRSAHELTMRDGILFTAQWKRKRARESGIWLRC